MRAASRACAIVLLLHSCACRSSDRGVGASAAPPTPTRKPTAAQSDPTAEDYPALKLPRGRVILKDAYQGSHLVEVEVAATEPARSRGLMWRRGLNEGQGMLFMFPHSQVLSFWMRNTLIPLDMIFINQELRIVGIVQQAEPQTLTSRKVNQESRYVLEVPGGWTEKCGIQAGSEVQLLGTSAITPL